MLFACESLAGLTREVEELPNGVADRSLASLARTRGGGRVPCFPEDFERATLVLIWEWFLLEVAVRPLL